MRFIKFLSSIFILLSIIFSPAGFSQGQSEPPRVWVLKSEGEILFLSAPTPTPTPLPEIVISLPGDVAMEMVCIPAGSFIMGSSDNEQDRRLNEGPLHRVTISQGFYLGKYEVTKAQWQAVTEVTPWSGYPYVINDPDSPAVCMSWNDLQSFITAMNQLGQGTFRLPSEAEWEYACRAETTTRFYWGDDTNYSMIGNYAWYDRNTWFANQKFAHIVGQKLPNAWGLYDMSGNVSEFCQDCWHDNYNGAPTNGNAWESPIISYQVIRGTGWHNTAQRYRSASRSFCSHIYRHNSIGIRLVRTP